MAVGSGLYPAFVHVEGVVVLAAGVSGRGKAGAEFDALDGGNTEDDLGDPVFHAVKDGLAHACGDAGNGALHDAANGVACLFCRLDPLAHGLSRRLGEGGKGSAPQGREGFTGHGHRVKGRVHYAPRSVQMRQHGNAPARQQLEADAPRHTQRRREPGGEMTATRRVLKAAELCLGGVIRVAGAGHVPQLPVIGGAGVRVADHRRQRCAAGDAAGQTG